MLQQVLKDMAARYEDAYDEPKLHKFQIILHEKFAS